MLLLLLGFAWVGLTFLPGPKFALLTLSPGLVTMSAYLQDDHGDGDLRGRQEDNKIVKQLFNEKHFLHIALPLRRG